MRCRGEHTPHPWAAPAPPPSPAPEDQPDLAQALMGERETGLGPNKGMCPTAHPPALRGSAAAAHRPRSPSAGCCAQQPAVPIPPCLARTGPRRPASAEELAAQLCCGAWGGEPHTHPPPPPSILISRGWSWSFAQRVDRPDTAWVNGCSSPWDTC